jgi:hypothetical protein
LDFDGREIKGGWSPAGLNWDDGVRAVDAEIEIESPDGVAFRADEPEELARVAGEWFEHHVAIRRPWATADVASKNCRYRALPGQNQTRTWPPCRRGRCR